MPFHFVITLNIKPKWPLSGQKLENLKWAFNLMKKGKKIQNNGPHYNVVFSDQNINHFLTKKTFQINTRGGRGRILRALIDNAARELLRTR